MSTYRRGAKRRHRRGVYGFGHISHLCSGYDFFKDGFSSNKAAMRRAWQTLQPMVFDFWLRAKKRDCNQQLPAGWWWFEQNREKPENQAEEIQYLKESGVLPDANLNEFFAAAGDGSSGRQPVGNTGRGSAKP